MRLADQVAIVTGGGGGIGRSIAVRLAAEGARVAVAGRTLQKLEETASAIAKAGGRALAVPADVTSREAVRELVRRTEGELGPVAILINNAGTDTKGRIEDLSEEVWDALMRLNLKGPFLCTQSVVGTMIRLRRGRIVNISSMAGRTGEPFTSAYCTTKFGLIGFTQALAQELGRHGITVNAVCPGPVETELIAKSIAQSAAITGESFDAFRDRFFVGPTPLGRMAFPEDVARAVAFLVSEDAAFITGCALNVSGGREMH